MKYPKVTVWDITKEYWKSAKYHWILAVTVLLTEAVGTLLYSIISPLYLKKFFDVITTTDPSQNNIASILISIIITIMIIEIFGLLIFRISGFSFNLFLTRVANRLVDRGFGYMIDHSYSFFANNFSGSLVQKFGRYHRSFGRLADKITADMVTLIVKITASFSVLYFIFPKMAYLMGLWFVSFLLISYILAQIKLKYDILGAEADSKLTAIVADSISNHSSIQLFAGAEGELQNVNKRGRELFRIFYIKWNLGTITDGIQALITMVAEFLIFYYGIRYWQLGIMSIGTFILVQSYIVSISGNLWNFSRVVRDMYEATADAREMVEILNLPHEIRDIPDANILAVSKGHIEFKNVTFAFGQNKSVLNNFNLTINAGEKVAVIGSSGAGKSTLIKLLLRLIDIQGGQICIDGQDIRTVTQNSLRENISLVPQDPALFHRTLMENIRYGKRDAIDGEVLEASRLAHCDLFIKEFPLKYETFVGERGIKLSGGEKQRVAIARAILKNAPILVLDEATSSLDSHSESLIQDALNTLMKGKTTIIIAHRLSTIRKADRIVVLGKEGVVEQGNHEELIKKGGTYARLWNLQAGGFNDKSIEDMLEA